MGVFASIYHPVGIPMLVQSATNPGLHDRRQRAGRQPRHRGRRDPHRLPGQVRRLARGVRGARRCSRIACGVALRARWCRARRWRRPSGRRSRSTCRRAVMARVFLVMTLAAISEQPDLQLHDQRQRPAPRPSGCAALVDDPATLGMLLAVVYTVASLAQLVVGKLIDRYPAQVGLPADRGRAGAAVRCSPRTRRAGRSTPSMLAVHDLRLRRHPVHRRDDRAVRGRPHALARGRHAPRGLVRRQLARRLAAGADGQGGGLHARC